MHRSPREIADLLLAAGARALTAAKEEFLRRMSHRGPTCLFYLNPPVSAESRLWEVLSIIRKARTVSSMSALFNGIRGIGFRRGPQRLLGGIAGGISAGMQVNVWLVRLLLLVAFLLPVVGVGLYLVVWALTPWQDGSIPLERALDSRNG